MRGDGVAAGECASSSPSPPGRGPEPETALASTGVKAKSCGRRRKECGGRRAGGGAVVEALKSSSSCDAPAAQRDVHSSVIKQPPRWDEQRGNMRADVIEQAQLSTLQSVGGGRAWRRCHQGACFKRCRQRALSELSQQVTRRKGGAIAKPKRVPECQKASGPRRRDGTDSGKDMECTNSKAASRSNGCKRTGKEKRPRHTCRSRESIVFKNITIHEEIGLYILVNSSSTFPFVGISS